MTVNAPHDPQVDDLGLTSENWLGLQYSRNYGTIGTAPGTIEAEASGQMDEHPQREIEHIAATEPADEAWRATRPGRAPQAEPAGAGQ